MEINKRIRGGILQNRSIYLNCLLKMNGRYPIYWVILAQLIFFLLYVSHDISVFFSGYYDEFLGFTKINSGQLFSANLYKAYTVTMIVLIPIQIVFLVIGSDKKIIDLMNRKNPNIFLLGNIIISILLIFFFSLGHFGLLRLLNTNIVASVFTPFITGHVGFSIAASILFLRTK